MSEVRGIHASPKDVRVTTEKHSISASEVITCGGLFSDRLVKLSGMEPPAKIVPFRGEYYELKASRRSLCRHLIYPVPDPNFPFLGVHFTRMVDGTVECGPNAVLALAREGYTWGTLRMGDLAESITYGGFVKLATKFWRTGLGEIHRSLSKAAFVKALSRLVPDLKIDDLTPGRAGVRAQAVSPDGTLVVISCGFAASVSCTCATPPAPLPPPHSKSVAASSNDCKKVKNYKLLSPSQPDALVLKLARLSKPDASARGSAEEFTIASHDGATQVGIA